MARNNREAKEPPVLDRISMPVPLFEKIRGKLASAALCSCLLAQGSALGQLSEDLWEGAGVTAEASVPASEECPPVPPEALKLARHLVTRGEEAPRRGFAEERDQMLNNESPKTSHDFQTLRYIEYQDTAEKYGLTVHDVRPYMQKIRAGYSKPYDAEALGGETDKYAQPFSVYLEQANEFLSLYGVEITVPEETNEVDEGNRLRVAQADELEARLTKDHIISMMEDFASFPEEYVRQITGLRKIKLLAGKQPGASAAYAVTSGNHDTIGLNILIGLSSGSEASILMHELYHLGDAKLCDGYKKMRNDPVYTKHNAEPYIDRQGGTDPRWTFEDIQQGVNYDMYLEGATSAEDFRMRVCRARAAVVKEHARQSFFDDYAAQSLVEDKADTGSRILSPEGHEAMTSLMTPPRVTAKYEVLLGRLAQASPALAHYFTAIQEQPSLSQSVLSSCKPS